MSQALFVGLHAAAWNAANYQGPAGSFGGAAGGFQAAVFFQPTYPNINSQIVGNLVGNRGWALTFDSGGLLKATYGDGSALHSITYDLAGRASRHWLLASMDWSAGELSLFVNGVIAVQSALANAPVASAGAMFVGGSDASFANPFTGIIAGVTYSAPLTSGVDPFAQAELVARTGQLALPDTTSVSVSLPQFCWQVQGYNESAAPTWKAATGGVVLTRNGNTSLVAQNAPANTWG